MADERPEDDEALDLTPEMEIDADEPEVDDDAEIGDENPDDEGDAEETIISFDGDEIDEDDKPGDSSVIRRMREELRQAKRELAEVRRVAQQPEIEAGEKPTLESCGYDEEEFETELDAWKERKAAAERAGEVREAEAREAQESWQADLRSFEQKKAQHGFADFADAQSRVEDTLNLAQQAVIVKAASDPALFLYAVGKSEAKLAELAKIKDPIKMAALVARMEGAIKVVKRRGAPEPDRPARGSAAMPGGKDKHLEKLEREAERTGDRTALIEYKRKQRERGKA